MVAIPTTNILNHGYQVCFYVKLVKSYRYYICTVITKASVQRYIKNKERV